MEDCNAENSDLITVTLFFKTEKDSRDLDEQAEEIRQNLINTDEATVSVFTAIWFFRLDSLEN